MRNIHFLSGLILVMVGCGDSKAIKACVDACGTAQLAAAKACGPYPEKGTATEQQANYDCTKKSLEVSNACVAACEKRK